MKQLGHTDFCLVAGTRLPCGWDFLREDAPPCHFHEQQFGPERDRYGQSFYNCKPNGEKPHLMASSIGKLFPILGLRGRGSCCMRRRPPAFRRTQIRYYCHIHIPTWTTPEGIPISKRCPEPFDWQNVNCMVVLGNLDFELPVRGTIPNADQTWTPIIFPSPGWGLDCELKFAGLRPLFENHVFLCMVTRGTHPSGRPADIRNMTSTDMAHDLELLRQWLGLDRLRLYSHNIGGTVALGYAELYPDRVSSLVLVDSKILDHDDTPTLMKFIQGRYADPKYTQSISALMIAANFSHPAYPKNDEEYRSLLLDMLAWYFANPELYQPAFATLVEANAAPQNWATIVHDKRNSLDPTPNKALMGQVVAPTLVIVGEDDAFCTQAVAEIMHAGIRGSKLVVFRECGHLPWIERTDDFLDEVKNWWGRY